MSAPAAPAEQRALGPPLAAAEPAAVVVGSIGYPTQIQKLATACAGGRALVRVRSVHGGSNGSYVYSCSDYACVVVVVLQGYEKATRSTDPVVKAAAVLLRTQIKAGLMQTSACVVTSVNLTHTTTCRSPPHLSLDNLASVPRVQYVFLKARSHEDVIAAVRELTGLELTASDVSRLKTETDDAFEATRATELAKLVSFLERIAACNAEFGAELILETAPRAGPQAAPQARVVVAFGKFKPAAFVNPSTESIKGARVLHLVVLWPWANAVEKLGPPLVSADAMHSKCRQGRIFNISMRCAKLNVSLLTMWSLSENSEAWDLMFARARQYLVHQFQDGMSIITDRGSALLAVMEKHPRIQHLYDRPHLIRNVMYHFPALNVLGEALRPLLDNVFFSRTEGDFQAAVTKLDVEWNKVKPAVDDPPKPPEDADADSESDAENPIEQHTKPRTYIQRNKGQTPSQYINSVGKQTFLLPCMTANNGDVSSANAAEAQGEGLKLVRRQSIARGIETMMRVHLRYFAGALKELKELAAKQEVLFPCWPFWEKWESELAEVDEYSYEALTEYTGIVRRIATTSGMHLGKTHRFTYDPGAPLASMWALLLARGHSCDGGCYLVQVREAPCVHALRGFRDMFPVRETGVPGVKRTDAELEQAREANARRYKAALLDITAPHYQVGFMLQRISALVAPGAIVLVNLDDVPGAVPLLPICDDRAPSLIKFSPSGRPGGTDARVLSRGEAPLLEAAGKRPRRSAKNSCRACKAAKLPGLGHTRKSPLCPVRLRAAAGTAAAGTAAAGTTAADTAAGDAAGVVGGAGAAASDEEDEEVDEDEADDDGEWTPGPE